MALVVRGPCHEASGTLIMQQRSADGVRLCMSYGISTQSDEQMGGFYQHGLLTAIA